MVEEIAARNYNIFFAFLTACQMKEMWLLCLICKDIYNFSIFSGVNLLLHVGRLRL